MASGAPNLFQTPLYGSSNFNIGLNIPGMASSMGTQQQPQNPPKAPGAGLKAKKQVILEDDDDVSFWGSKWPRSAPRVANNMKLNTFARIFSCLINRCMSPNCRWDGTSKERVPFEDVHIICQPSNCAVAGTVDHQ